MTRHSKGTVISAYFLIGSFWFLFGKTTTTVTRRNHVHFFFLYSETNEYDIDEQPTLNISLKGNTTETTHYLNLTIITVEQIGAI